MSNRIDYRITAAKGLRLPFHVAGAAITAGRLAYDPNDPDKDHHKAVALNALQTVDLAVADGPVLGEVVVVEPADGMSTKLTVNLGPVMWLRYTGTAPTFGQAVVGAAGTGGDVGNGFVKGVAQGTANAVGKVIQVDTVARECAVLIQ